MVIQLPPKMKPRILCLTSDGFPEASKHSKSTTFFEVLDCWLILTLLRLKKWLVLTISMIIRLISFFFCEWIILLISGSESYLACLSLLKHISQCEILVTLSKTKWCFHLTYLLVLFFHTHFKHWFLISILFAVFTLGKLMNVNEDYGELSSIARSVLTRYVATPCLCSILFVMFAWSYSVTIATSFYLTIS
jgi:hypothetical protein